MALARAVIDLIVPMRCAGCRAPGEAWCDECRAGVVRAPGLSVTGCDGVVVGGRYTGALRSAVLAMKRDRPGLAAVLADGLWDGRLPSVDVVTWVPAGPARRARGYDQGRRLARAAARMIGRPARPLLVRRGATGQSGLSAGARRDNAARVITARRAVPGVRVLVVDDVVTTRASLERSVAVLRHAGARSVSAAVLAATVRESQGAPV